MKIRTEELFDKSDSLFIVTTNGNLRADGRLVMGAGAAADAKHLYPNIELIAGKSIIEHGIKRNGFYLYGFLLIAHEIAIFQTKGNWRDKADINLLQASCNMLRVWCNENPCRPVRMNFPGIGLGGLSEHAVLAIIKYLPDSVTVCKR